MNDKRVELSHFCSKVPQVAVLMCTYNPGQYLAEQLRSIAEQSLPPSFVLISDDSASHYSDVRILEDLERAGLSETKVVKGPRKGFAANFLSALCCAELEGEYFAFSDQDDIWMADKLLIATEQLSRVPAGQPAVYCGRTRLVTEEDEDAGYSTVFRRQPSFANALVQSIAGGNTMVLNKSARELLLKAGECEIVSHDWWVYLLVSGADGAVIYDETPTIRYRQHDDNLVGGHTSFLAHLNRVRLLLFHDRFKNWNDINVESLEKAKYLLTAQNRELLEDFVSVRSGSLLHRLRHLRKSGVYRQTPMGNFGLLIATLTGKI
jgi:glycosyltransferase involved in cell wall biosynthesis